MTRIHSAVARASRRAASTVVSMSGAENIAKQYGSRLWGRLTTCGPIANRSIRTQPGLVRRFPTRDSDHK
jgi:hypothetical protein